MNHRAKRGAAAITVAIVLMAVVFMGVGYVYVASQLKWPPFTSVPPSGTVTFPPNPSIGQTFTYHGVTYTWNGAQWTTPSGTTAAYAGPITVKIPYYIFNNTISANTGAYPPAAVLLHADQQTPIGFGNPGGTSSSPNSISGILSIADNGIAYLLINPGGNSTLGLLYNLITTNNAGIIVASPMWVTYQGQNYASYKLNLAGLSLAGGLQAGTTTVNIYGYSTITPALLSLLNTTAATATTFTNVVTTSYLSGLNTNPWGFGTKILRMQVTYGAGSGTAYQGAWGTGNATDAENGLITLKSVTINWGQGIVQTYNNIINNFGTGGNNATDYTEVTAGPGQPYLCGNILNNEFYGLPWLCGQSDTSTMLTVQCTWNVEMSAAADTFCPNIVFTYIGSTGGSSTFAHLVGIS